MGMEYHPVEGPVADQKVRHWRARNYETNFTSDGQRSLGKLAAHVDEILTSTSSGLTYGTDEKVNETRYEQNYSESSSVPNFFIPITTALEMVYREEKSDPNIREHYSVNVAHYDEDGEYLFGASYMILRFVGGKLDMMIQRSTDETAAVLTGNVEYFDKGADRWGDATKYDADQLLRSLKQLHPIHQDQEGAA
jgi:hypothetical protein